MEEHNTGPALVRSFFRKDGSVTVGHDLCIIPPEFREKRLGNQLLKIWIQQYISVGIAKIEVLAALKDGGYVWARHFFTADKRAEVDVIFKKAQDELSPANFELVKTIYDLYYNTEPTGKHFPMAEWAAFKFMAPILSGSEWEGTLDFNNSEQLHNFISYIYKTI